jgi:hypothetical protein
MHKGRQIIETYRNADFEKRLNLFLSYRYLRDQFTEIDNSERYSLVSDRSTNHLRVEKESFFQRLLLRWIGA